MPVEFRCPHCGKLLRTPDNTRGKKGRCPHCKAINSIPSESEPAQSVPGASPVPNSPDLFTQQPYANPAPALPPASTDLFANLPAGAQTGGPLDLLGGYEPPPAAPSYGAPLGDSNYGGAYAGDAYAGGGYAPSSYPDAGGYSAPAAGYAPYAAPHYSASEPDESQPLDDRDREGIPWEDRRRDGALLGTVKMVLLQPAYAFGSMHRTGGFGAPLTFSIVGNLLGGLIFVGYDTLWQLLSTLVFMGLGQTPIELAGFMLLAVGIRLVVSLVVMAFTQTIGAIVGAFLHAAVLHLMLMMLNGARGGFEATFRLTCYAQGSLALLNIIPCLAPLAMFVMYWVVMIIGVRWTHEISVGKSVSAVLLTAAIFFGLIVIPFVLFVLFVIMLIFGLSMRQVF